MLRLKQNNLPLYLGVFLLSILLCSCSSNQNIAPVIEKGQLTISKEQIENNTVVSLDGDWQFYWGKLLNYTEISATEPDALASVPNVWTNYTVKGNPLPGKGHASYLLHIKTDLPVGTILALRIHSLSSSYSLFVNEKQIGSSGVVGVSKEQEKPQYRPQTVMFTVPDSEFEIIFHVSNYSYARGGFWRTVSLGNPAAGSDLQDNILGKELFLLGTFSLGSFFYLAIFLLRSELKHALYFSLFCFLFMISMDMMHQILMSRIFPQIPFSVIVFIWYTVNWWAIYFFIRYIHEVFPSRFSSIVAKYSLVLTCCWTLFCIVLPTEIYTKTSYLGTLFEIAGVTATILITANAVKNGCKPAWLNLTSIAILLGCYIHDLLYWSQIITSFGEIFFIAVPLFLLFEMLIQAQRIKDSYDAAQAAELKFLQAQIKPHFLFNTLNTCVSISRYDAEKARNLLEEFSNYLRKSFNFSEFGTLTTLRDEMELVEAYLQIEKSRFEERLRTDIRINVSNEIAVKVPLLILQPIVENAVIHGVLPALEGGRVVIEISEDSRFIYFTVSDDGVGFSGEFKGESNIGLKNIDKRLRKRYGYGLQITTGIAEGTEVSWKIPK